MKQQIWLYITNRGLTLFAIGQAKSGLPFLNVLAIEKSDNAINASTQLSNWVKSKCKGKVNLLLHHSLYQQLLSDVPDVPEEELRSAIELKAADLLNYDIDDAVLDVIQLPSEAYRGRMRMAFIIASRKGPLRDWLMALASQGVAVDVIDVDSTVLRNLAISQQQYSESGIIHLKSTSSRLILNFNEEMVLSRSFDIGLSNLLSERVIDDDELEITVDDSTQSDIQIDSLVLEIRRSFDYYESQLGLGAIAEMMFLCDEQYEHIAHKVVQKLGVRFVMLKPSDFMTIQMPSNDLDPVTFYSLIGVAFRGGDS